MSKSGSGKLTFTDLLFVLLSIVLLSGMIGFEQQMDCRAVLLFEPFIMVYCLLRILFSVSYKWTSFLLLLVVACFCTYELCLGYVQLIRNLGKNIGQEVCLGSFTNSGPFGCFLALCSSLFIAVYTKVSNKAIRMTISVIVIMSLTLMLCTLSRASVLSFMVSMSFLVVKQDKAKSYVRRYWAVIALSVIILGTGAYLIKKRSADGRMLMTRICLRMISENGLTGVGLGNYAAAYGKAQADFFANYLGDGLDELDIDALPDNLASIADCPTFAFNEYLRLGIETGPVAMLLMIGLVILTIINLYRNDSWWCYPLICLSVFACFSYPLEVGGLALSMVVCLASNDSKHETGTSGILFFSFLFIVFGSFFYSHYSSVNKINMMCKPSFLEQLCGNRHKLYEVRDYSAIVDGLYDEQVLFTYGQNMNRIGKFEKSDSIMLLGTQISSDPMFWNVMGNNSLQLGRFREAEARYKQAFRMVPNRLYPLCLLAKLYYTEGDTVRFMEMADVVYEFNPKIESANTELLRTEIKELKENIISGFAR
jgi:tetratricopeptide (TPR) repeat protein